MSLPGIAIVYGLGSAGPSEIVEAATGVARPIFVTDTRIEHCAAIDGALRSLGQTIDLAMADDVNLRAHGVRGITTFAESRIRTTATLATRSGLPFHSLETASALTDKAIQRQLLNGRGVSTTKFRKVLSASGLPMAADEIGYPVVVKPATGEGGRHTVRCWNSDQVRSLTKSLPAHTAWVVEEELTSGGHPEHDWLADYVSVESAVHEGAIHHFAISDKLPLAAPFRERGMLMPSSLGQEHREAITALATAALNALGVEHGLTHTEIKLTTAGPRIIEVNGRLGGSVARLMRRAAAVDPIRSALLLALGQPDIPMPTWPSGVALQFISLPPMELVQVHAVPSKSDLMKIEGIWAAERGCRRGAVLDWRGGMMERLFTAWAEAGSYQEASSIVQQLYVAETQLVRLSPADAT